MSEDFEIESGIPVPPAASRGNSKGYSDALKKLGPGDSVRIPTTMKALTNSAARILGPGNYTMRAEGGGTRVWRNQSKSALLRVVENTLRTKAEEIEDAREAARAKRAAQRK